MMQVNTAYRPYFTDAPETQKLIALFIGSRNSGKSRALAQKDMVDMMRSRIRIAYVRKVGASITDSMYKEFRDVVVDNGFADQFEFLVNPLTIRCANGSEIITKGCDDPEKLKSLAEVDRVRIEELSELSESDFDTVLFSVRGGDETRRKQVVCSMNPVKSFVKDRFFFADGKTLRYPDETYFLHTTWRDNRYCGADWSRRMEQLREQNEALHAIVSEGVWADMEGLVYKYEPCDALPAGGVRRLGLDFGFNDPCALVDVVFSDGAFYVDELVYERGLDEGELCLRMEKAGVDRRARILGDNAMKMTIQGVYNRGWNIHPCEKMSVEDSVKWLLSFPIFVTRRSVNLQRELDGYVWSKDKAGRPLDVPVDYDNHALDGFRYAAIDIMPHTRTARLENQIVTMKAAGSVMR